MGEVRINANGLVGGGRVTQLEDDEVCQTDEMIATDEARPEKSAVL